MCYFYFQKFGQTLFCSNEDVTKPTSLAQYCHKPELETDNGLGYFPIVVFVIFLVIIAIYCLRRLQAKKKEIMTNHSLPEDAVNKANNSK